MGRRVTSRAARSRVSFRSISCGATNPDAPCTGPAVSHILARRHVDSLLGPWTVVPFLAPVTRISYPQYKLSYGDCSHQR